jgi:hypothetical protein
VGTAATVFRRASRGLPITAVTCGKVGGMSCDRVFLKQQESAQ